MEDGFSQVLLDRGWTRGEKGLFTRGPASLWLFFTRLRAEILLLQVHAERRSGHGRRALKDIAAAADNARCPVLAEVRQMSSHGPGEDILVRFYESEGFACRGLSASGLRLMVRVPRQSRACSSEKLQASKPGSASARNSRKRAITCSASSGVSSVSRDGNIPASKSRSQDRIACAR